MVREVKKEGQTLYVCEECGMAYKEKKWTEKCEAYCKRYHGCNLEITQYAVPLE